MIHFSYIKLVGPLEKRRLQKKLKAKNGFLKKYQRGDPLGRQGFESLRGGVRPPLNPPLIRVQFFSVIRPGAYS